MLILSAAPVVVVVVTWIRGRLAEDPVLLRIPCVDAAVIIGKHANHLLMGDVESDLRRGTAQPKLEPDWLRKVRNGEYTLFNVPTIYEEHDPTPQEYLAYARYVSASGAYLRSESIGGLCRRMTVWPAPRMPMRKVYFVSYPRLTAYSLILPVGVGLILHVVPGVRARRRRLHGLCPECGYDLRGNTSRVCPECGSAIEAAPPTFNGRSVAPL